MHENKTIHEDELGLFELWEKLRNGWWVVLGGLILGVAGMTVALGMLKPTYEALAIVQVGQVGQVGQFKQPVQSGSSARIVNVVEVAQVGQHTVSSRLVEPPLRAFERMKSPSFLQRTAGNGGDPEWLQAITRFGAGREVSLRIVERKGGEELPLIELRAKGRNPESARRRAEAVIGELAETHAKLAEPALARIRADLALNQEKLASAERDLAALTKLVNAAGIKDNRFTQLALMTSLRIQKEAEAFEQREIIMALEMALEEPATQPAQAIEAVFVPEKPVSPNKVQLLTLGALIGLLAGLAWVLLSDAWRRARAL